MRKIITGQKSLLPNTVTGLMLAAIFTIMLAGTKTFSQTVAIGHVTAEVIESVSAASKAITSFDYLAIPRSDEIQSKNSYLISETVNLGVITLQSGRNINCNVVIKSASLIDNSGNGFTFEPTVKNNTYASASKEDGSQTIQLDGQTKMTSCPVSGLYTGSYTVVIGYN